MAHKQKYTKGTLGHMLSHYDRSKNVPDLLYPDKTINNYNLAVEDQPLEQLDFVHKRLSEIKVFKRKDVNVMVDWIITAPKDLLVTDEENFFNQTYLFLLNRYGKDNVISSYVHKDETTPHMHFAFVPVFQTKDNTFKLSAKEVITRNDLRSFHTDLDKHLTRFFGYSVGILNEATIEGNKSISQLKANSIHNEVVKAEKRLEQIKAIEFTTPSIEEKKEPTKSILGKETISYQEYTSLFNKYEVLQKDFITIKNSLEVQKDSYNTLNSELNTVNKALKRITGKNYYRIAESAQDLIIKLYDDIGNLKEKNTRQGYTIQDLENEISIYKPYYENQQSKKEQNNYDLDYGFDL